MGSEERPEGSLLDPETLRRLFRQLAETDVEELEIQTDDARLYLRRASEQTWIAREAAGDGETESTPGIPIVAPLAGAFYLRPSPEQPPYVAVGDSVEAGQVVGLIETMKLFNEVTAEVPGQILSLNVRDGDLVEAGQTLMSVWPGDVLEAD